MCDRRTLARIPAFLPLLLAVLASAGPARGDDGSDAKVIHDVPYVSTPNGSPLLRSLDLYVPARAGASPRPIVVYVHGGAWRMGDKRRVDEKPRLFLDAGFLVASVNYRLSPAVRHPAHVEDVAAALAWLRANAAAHGGDPARLVLVGHSAGAHLVALVATDVRRLEAAGVPPGAIRGVVPLDGAGYDIPAQIAANPLARGMFESAFGADAAGQLDASPLRHARPGRKPPPFLLVHAGDRAASRAQAEALAAALERAGGRAALRHAPDKNHGSVNRDLGRPGDALTGAVLDFVRGATGATGETGEF